MQSSKSQELELRAKRVFAANGATHLTRMRLRQPYIVHAQGATKTDEDGVEFLDYVMGHGSLLLGHSHQSVVSAVKAQAEAGFHYGANHRVEIEWAEAIQRMMPNAERIEPCACGQEANMLGIRVAQHFTGRKRVLHIREHLHGWADSVTLLERWAASDTQFAPFSLDAVAKLLQSREFAVLLAEAGGGHMGGQVPMQGAWYRALVDLAHDNGTLFLLDEVVTGFREAVGGFQSLHGIRPDLFSLGKVIGGGLGIGALCGRAEIMSALKEIGHTGTWNGGPLPCSAGLATLKIIECTSGEPLLQAASAAAVLRDGINQAASQMGVQLVHAYCRAGSIVHMYFGPRERPVEKDDGVTPPTCSVDTIMSHWNGQCQDRFGALLIERKVSTLSGRMFILSAAHTQSEIERTVSVAAECLAAMKSEGVFASYSKASCVSSGPIPPC